MKFRLAALFGGLLLSGCMSDEFSQSGTAYSSCSGLIVIGCNATQRNVIMPSPDEALALALALAILAAVLFVVYVFKRASDG